MKYHRSTETAAPLLLCCPLGAACRCPRIGVLPTTCAFNPATLRRLALPLYSRIPPQRSPLVLAIPFALLPNPLPPVARASPPRPP